MLWESCWNVRIETGGPSIRSSLDLGVGSPFSIIFSTHVDSRVSSYARLYRDQNLKISSYFKSLVSPCKLTEMRAYILELVVGKFLVLFLIYFVFFDGLYLKLSVIDLSNFEILEICGINLKTSGFEYNLKMFHLVYLMSNLLVTPTATVCGLSPL